MAQEMDGKRTTSPKASGRFVPRRFGGDLRTFASCELPPVIRDRDFIPLVMIDTTFDSPVAVYQRASAFRKYFPEAARQ